MADRQKQTGAALVGTGGALALAPGAANKAKGHLVRRQMDRSIGTLGGLTGSRGATTLDGRDVAAYSPVRPGDLKSQRGARRPEGGHYPSARTSAALRYQHGAKPYLERLAKPAVGVRAGNAMKLGGLGLAVTGALASTHGKREVTKAVVQEWPDLPSPQYSVGIPPTRADPISPLAMSASSGIMAGFLVGAAGKSLSRRQKKRIRQGAYGFAGARGMVYSPLGFGRSNSA